MREITLLGQNVNGYHGEAQTSGGAESLAGLIKTLARIEGLDRIRYTTSHPRDMDDDLIELHGTEEKLMPYLHLPFQAGSDRILSAMNRKHTAAEYVALIQKIRKARPDIALSTDIIVGFPGETEDEFQQTIDLVREVGFAHAFSFKYSARPGTPAASIEDQVADAEKSHRLERLMAAIEVGQRAFNQKPRRPRRARVVRQARTWGRAAVGTVALPSDGARRCACRSPGRHTPGRDRQGWAEQP